MRMRMSVRRIATWSLAVMLTAAGAQAAAGDPPLVEAAKTADAAAVRALLKTHVDVNAAAADGTTALHWAARRDDLATVTELLHAGAHVSAGNRYGVTPLLL